MELRRASGDDGAVSDPRAALQKRAEQAQRQAVAVMAKAVGQRPGSSDLVSLLLHTCLLYTSDAADD